LVNPTPDKLKTMISFANLRSTNQNQCPSFVTNSGSDSGSDNDNAHRSETHNSSQQLFNALVYDETETDATAKLATNTNTNHNHTTNQNHHTSIFIDKRYWMSDKSAKICTECSQ
jgi:hypothetical protein